MRNLPIKMLVVATVLLGGFPAVAGDAWTQFRGPTGQGHAEPSDLPETWSEDQNVVWKARIRGLGWSTPVVYGDQVWVTTATPDGHDMYALCLDRETGRIVYELHLFHNEEVEPLGNAVNCYASPSPVIEEGRVYAHFGSYGTACIDTASGSVLWERRDLPCRHYRGPSSSPVLFEDKLILTFDGADLQYMVALDKRTGKTLWHTDRSTKWDDWGPDGQPVAEGDYRKAHSTPLIVSIDRQPVMMSVGAKAAFAYDPRDGRELWHITFGGFSSSTMPLYGHGLFYIIAGYGRSELFAVRPGGSGHVNDTHIAWQTTRGVPSKPSPILVDDLIYLVHDSGVTSCIEAATGDEVWRTRLTGTYSASPIYADGKIYICSEEGKTTVLKPGRSLEVLAENELESGFMASPVAVGRSLFLRTRTHLYRIEER